MAIKTKLINEIEDIATVRNMPESVVIAEAIKVGIGKLWKESVLDRYLTGKVSRKRAVELIGLPLVKLAEKQKKAIIEDINWGLNA